MDWTDNQPNDRQTHRIEQNTKEIVIQKSSIISRPIYIYTNMYKDNNKLIRLHATSKAHEYAAHNGAMLSQ